MALTLHPNLFPTGIKRETYGASKDFALQIENLPGQPTKEVIVHDLRHFEQPPNLPNNAKPGEFTLPSNYSEMLKKHGVVWIRQQPLFGSDFKSLTRLNKVLNRLRNGQSDQDGVLVQEVSSKLMRAIFPDYTSRLYKGGLFVRPPGGARLGMPAHATMFHTDWPESPLSVPRPSKIVNEWSLFASSNQKPLVFVSRASPGLPEYAHEYMGVRPLANHDPDNLYLYLSGMNPTDKLVFLQYDSSSQRDLGRVAHSAICHPTFPEPTIPEGSSLRDLFDANSKLRFSVELRDVLYSK